VALFCSLGEVFHENCRLWLEKDALVVRVRENALWYNPLVCSSIIEILVVVVCSRDAEHVERVKNGFLGCLPVFIVEIVVDPHELLVDKLWDDALLCWQSASLR